MVQRGSCANEDSSYALDVRTPRRQMTVAANGARCSARTACGGAWDPPGGLHHEGVQDGPRRTEEPRRRSPAAPQTACYERLQLVGTAICDGVRNGRHRDDAETEMWMPP